MPRNIFEIGEEQLRSVSGRNRRSYVSTSGGSRPSDNGGGGGGGRDPDPEIRGGGGGGGLHKQFFRPFGPQFGLKLRGGGALPWIPYCRTEALSDVVRVPAQKLSGIV